MGDAYFALFMCKKCRNLPMKHLDQVSRKSNKNPSNLNDLKILQVNVFCLDELKYPQSDLCSWHNVEKSDLGLTKIKGKTIGLPYRYITTANCSRQYLKSMSND